MNIKERFREWQEDNHNFVTPEIDTLLEVTTADNAKVIIEISKQGERFNPQSYGVSVFVYSHADDTFKGVAYDCSQLFQSENASSHARQYASRLSEAFNQMESDRLFEDDALRGAL